MKLVQRVLETTISLAPPSSGDQQQQSFSGSPGNNTVTLSGFRTSAKIIHAGGPSDSTLDLTIYGMARSQMDQLSTLGMQINLVPKNGIVLTAGDSSSSPATVFVGYILAAYADFNAQPDVAFRITAHCGLPQAVVPTPVSSYKGALDVANFMSSIASVMGLRFENNGITAKLSNPYFPGSAVAQMRACAKAAGINANIINGTLCIWPKNGSRDSGTMPLIAPPPQGGMIGYPIYTAYGIQIKSLFNPSVGFGQKIKVQCDLKPACGTWAIYGLDYTLDANVPNGKWEMLISAYNPKFPTPVIN